MPPDAGDDSEEGDGLEKNKASSSSGPDPSRKVKHRTDAEKIKFVLGEKRLQFMQAHDYRIYFEKRGRSQRYIGRYKDSQNKLKMVSFSGAV